MMKVRKRIVTSVMILAAAVFVSGMFLAGRNGGFTDAAAYIACMIDG